MYSSLPKNEKTIYIKHTGDVTGLVYEGNFIIKCVLTLGDKRFMELERTRLLADYLNPTDALHAYAKFIAGVNARIIKAPQWWTDNNNGLGILDEDVILVMDEEFKKAEAEWKSAVKKKSEPAPSKEGESVNP